ncbi:NADPH-dependent FMN reductase [Paenibacillus sp. Soil724D2]|uniref:NADPH-dependent FMN reductase n=1 Tax=Paenibacillus sp. (strain Soil724D2) TaxID=1736392 RepID=UPI00071534CB|nr:NAD(P)H-dependent oxidoreductase [Paenibacillus sp. Soil724D2]KRE36432.1 NADH-dependent FMN reductase [Paenibacillus sp. Soil724D2]
MKLLGISGTIIGEKTASAVKQVVEHAKSLDERLETDLLDLRDYKVEFCDGRQVAEYNEDTQKVIKAILSADCFIIGTPIFQASLAAPLKNLFDLLPPTAFRNKVIGFVGTGGTYQHFLVIENQLKPIAGYFRAYTAPDYVYANREHFDSNNRIVDSSVVERIEALAAQVLHMSKSLIS